MSKTKNIVNFSLETWAVHTFKFYFMVYKCLEWPPSAARTTSGQYENSSQMPLRMSRSTALIAAVIRSFMSSIFFKRNETNFVFNTPTQEKVTNSEVPGSGTLSAVSEAYSIFPTNPSLRHVFTQISSNPKMPMWWCSILFKNKITRISKMNS